MGRHLDASSCYCREFYISKHKFLVNKLLPTVLAFLSSASLLSAADGVSPSPYKLTEIFGLPVTNSILTTWAISLLLILVIRFSVGTPKLVPGKGQAVVENLVGGLRDLLLPIVGKRPSRWHFHYSLAYLSSS